MDSIQLANIKRISEASKSNRLVVFVGAGVSMNSEIPSWNELIQALKKELPSNLKDEADDLKTAQLYKDSRGHKEYIDKIKKELKYGKASFNPIHEAILNLNPCHIITTNYDDLLEQALRNIGKQYQLIRKDEDLPHTQYANMLIKMHGDFETNNIVLTENDYYNYKDNFPLINAFVQSLFATNLILFVGFSFNDMNLKIILNSLKKLLKNDFQPVYLLSNNAADNVHISYFKNKGVNVTWLSDKQLKEIPENDGFADNLNRILTSEGKQLYKQLRYIKSCSDGTLGSFNLIDALYERIQSHWQELPYIATKTEYILPIPDIEFSEITTLGIRISSNYMNELMQNIKTFSYRKQILKAKKKEISFLKRVAARNGIYYIIDTYGRYKANLFSQASLERERKAYKKDSIDYIQIFDYKEASVIIQKKSLSNSLSFSYEDLELPYAYYMLGKYYDAYLCYKQYAEFYWKMGKHILFFICKYNMKTLSNKIFNELWRDRLKDVDTLCKEAREIDLESILNMCQFAPNVKKILSDLTNNRYSLESIKKSTKLANEILDAKRIVENGGVHSNNFIQSIENIAFRMFNFSCINYIINVDTTDSCITFNNSISGLLNAHTIPENNTPDYYPKSSRLKEIDRDHLTLMIFTITYTDLEKIYKTNKIDSIYLSINGIEYLNKIIKNINEQHQYITSINAESLFLDRLNKIILLTIKSKNDIENDVLLFNIACKYGLVNSKKNYQLNQLLAVLSHKISNKSVELSFITKVEQLNMPETFTIDDIDNIAYYYPIVNSEMKQEIIKRIKPDQIGKCEICAELIINYNIPLFNPDTLTVFIEKVKRDANSINLENCIYSIYKLYKITDNQDMKNIISVYIKESDFLAFLMSPKQYNKNSINIEWLYYCEDEDLKYFLSDTIWKEKLKQYAIESKDNDFKDRIWNLL